MNQDIAQYHAEFSANDKLICEQLKNAIEQNLPQAIGKVWHGSPVWFIDENPIVGYSKQKNHVQLLFWSGQSFGEPSLTPVGKHKAAEMTYTDALQINTTQLSAWLSKAEQIQWDYKNIVKRNGELVRLR